MSCLTRRIRIALYFICSVLWIASQSCQAAATPIFRTVTIGNTEPRRDQHGQMIDAHDGCLQFFHGRYYLYGTAYGKSAGYSIHNRFRVYSSPDLEHWRFEGELLKSPPDGVYYRPYVVFNPRTRKYVLYYNWFPRLFAGRTGVAVSDTPVGPFTIVHTKVNLSRAAGRPGGSFRGLTISGVGDGSLFVDDDGTGYFIYAAAGDHAVGIDRLTPDFLGSTGESSGVLAKGCEAPAMFRRGSRYYVLFDSTCCFCAAGSGARVYVASKPLGPYAELQNMNRDASGRPIVAAQQTFVAKVPSSEGTSYIWMADRWGSRPDGMKGHDLQYWSPPLQFAPDGGILPIQNVAEWKISIQLGQQTPERKNLYRWPQKKNPHPLKIDPCTGAALPPEN